MVRVLTGVGLLMTVASWVYWGPVWSLVALSSVVSAYAFWEFLRMLTARPSCVRPSCVRPSRLVVAGLTLTAGAFPWLGWFWGQAGLLPGLLLCLLGWLVPLCLRYGTQLAAGVSIGVWAIPFSISHVALLLRLDAPPDVIRPLLFCQLVLIASADTAAMLAGRTWGKRLLAPKLSPQKTLVGALAALAAGSICGTIAASWLAPTLIPQHTAATQWLLGTLCGLTFAACGICGDLFESAFKRTAGQKDSGRLLPGHGGLLDRIDSFLLTPPLLYYLYLFTL